MAVVSGGISWRSVAGSVVAALMLAACGSIQAHDWGVVALDGDAIDIRIVVGSSSCHHLDRVEIEETASEVEVVAFVRGPGPFQGCTADLGFSPLMVKISLGDRRLTGCLLGEGHFDARVPRTSCADIVPFP